MNSDDLAWGTVTPHRCRHPRVSRVFTVTDPTTHPISGYSTCGSCGQPVDPDKARRGRNNRSRGNAIEREVAKQLGLRRVGQYGGPEDVSGEAFVVQVKSTSPNKVTGRYAGWFSDRVWNELKRLPANAGQTPLLIVTDAPGPGHKRRAVVMLTLEDWIALHGNLTPDV